MWIVTALKKIKLGSTEKLTVSNVNNNNATEDFEVNEMLNYLNSHRSEEVKLELESTKEPN